jgi:hypothetical protein
MWLVASDVAINTFNLNKFPTFCNELGPYFSNKMSESNGFSAEKIIYLIN